MNGTIIIVLSLLVLSIGITVVVVLNLRSILRRNTNLTHELFKERKRRKSLYELFTIADVPFGENMYTIEYAYLYKEEFNLVEERKRKEKIIGLLEAYGFGTDNWSEDGFRYECRYQHGMRSIRIVEQVTLDRPES